MVDRLSFHLGEVSESQFEICTDSMFVEDGVLTLPGIMENIAQTCAARIGYEALAAGDNVKIGVIGAVTGLTVNHSPAVGEHLTTRIEVEQEVFNMTLVKATVTSDKGTVAETRMKIALTNNEPES